MKCIKKASEVKRVEDEEAVVLVKSGWAYCPKSEWKSRRPAKSNKVADIADEAVVELEVSENFKSSKKGMKVKKDRVPRNEARGEKVESSGKDNSKKSKGPRPTKPSK